MKLIEMPALLPSLIALSVLHQSRLSYAIVIINVFRILMDDAITIDRRQYNQPIKI